MPKRKWGYILFAALVISGFAGISSSNTLTKAERKKAIEHLKESRANLFKAVKGLSEEQLNYRSAPDRWTIKECVYHITLSEKNLWDWLEGVMKAPANPEKRKDIQITDEKLVATIEDRSFKAQAGENFDPTKASWSSLKEALDQFKSDRNKHLQYIRTTTESLRDHVTETPFGPVDAYQLILFLSGHNNRHVAQIEEIKRTAGFP